VHGFIARRFITYYVTKELERYTDLPWRHSDIRSVPDREWLSPIRQDGIAIRNRMSVGRDPTVSLPGPSE